MPFLDAATLAEPIRKLIETWIAIGQTLVASVGVLAFIFAFACMS